MSWSGKPAFQYTTCPVFRCNASRHSRSKAVMQLRVSAAPGAILSSVRNFKIPNLKQHFEKPRFLPILFLLNSLNIFLQFIIA
jgi:hypothetical protein